MNGSSHVTNYCVKQRSCWLAQSVEHQKGHPMNFQLTNNQLRWRHPWKSSKSSAFLKVLAGFGQELGRKFNEKRNFHVICSIPFQTVVSAISVRFPRSRKIIGPNSAMTHDMGVMALYGSTQEHISTLAAHECMPCLSHSTGASHAGHLGDCYWSIIHISSLRMILCYVLALYAKQWTAITQDLAQVTSTRGMHLAVLELTASVWHVMSISITKSEISHYK